MVVICLPGSPAGDRHPPVRRSACRAVMDVGGAVADGGAVRSPCPWPGHRRLPAQCGSTASAARALGRALARLTSAARAGGRRRSWSERSLGVGPPRSTPVSAGLADGVAVQDVGRARGDGRRARRSRSGSPSPSRRSRHSRPASCRQRASRDGTMVDARSARAATATRPHDNESSARSATPRLAPPRAQVDAGRLRRDRLHRRVRRSTSSISSEASTLQTMPRSPPTDVTWAKGDRGIDGVVVGGRCRSA